MSDDVKIELTDAEWMSLIDQTDEGLPYCCANISTLRDDIISIARYGRELSAWSATRFLRHMYWCRGEVEDLPVVQKLFQQVIANPNHKKTWEALLELDKHEREKDMP